MELEVKTTCPLGHSCEKVVGDHIERCAWFVRLEGENPQTGQPVNEWKCAMAWQPILAVEQSAQIRRVACSVQEAGNRSLEQQEKAIKVLNDGANTSAS